MRRALAFLLLAILASVPAFASLPAVVLRWTAPPNDAGDPTSGACSSYEMRWSQTAIGADTAAWWTAANVVSGLPTPGTPGSEDSVRVPGTFYAGTPYYFLLRSYDAVPNASGYSNVAEFCAPESVMVLVWTAPGDDGSGGGAAAQYAGRWSFREVGADTASWWASADTITGMPTPSTPGAADSVSISGVFQNGRIYHFVIRAADEVPNWSGYSSTQFYMADTTTSCSIGSGL